LWKKCGLVKPWPLFFVLLDFLLLDALDVFVGSFDGPADVLCNVRNMFDELYCVKHTQDST
jgi:hypothetical protein